MLPPGILEETVSFIGIQAVLSVGITYYKATPFEDWLRSGRPGARKTQSAGPDNYRPELSLRTGGYPVAVSSYRISVARSCPPDRARPHGSSSRTSED